MTDLLIMLIEFLAASAQKVFPHFDFVAESGYDFLSNIQALVEWLKTVNFLIPLGDMVTIMGLVISFVVVEWGAFVANWIIRRIADFIP